MHYMNLSNLFKISICREICANWILKLSIISLPIFDLLFDYLIGCLYMRVLKLTLGKIIISTNFPLFSAFQCEASGRTRLTVQTHAVLSIASLTSGPSGLIGITSERDPYKFLSISLLSLPNACLYIFIDLYAKSSLFLPIRIGVWTVYTCRPNGCKSSPRLNLSIGVK